MSDVTWKDRLSYAFDNTLARGQLALVGWLAGVSALFVGAMSYIEPTLFGRTVWRHFGADYGYFPLFQPLIGLVWLLLPETLRAYGIHLPYIKSDPVTNEYAE